MGIYGERVDSGSDYNYILSMPIYNLTKEKKEELCKKRDERYGYRLCMVLGYLGWFMWGGCIGI